MYFYPNVPYVVDTPSYCECLVLFDHIPLFLMVTRQNRCSLLCCVIVRYVRYVTWWQCRYFAVTSCVNYFNYSNCTCVNYIPTSRHTCTSRYHMWPYATFV